MLFATFSRRRNSLFGALALAACLAGCGIGGLNGTYTPDERGFFDKLTFTSSDKVEITFFGSTAEGSYVVSGDKLKITVNNQTQVLTIGKNGCLEGGGLIGTYCKK